VYEGTGPLASANVAGGFMAAYIVALGAVAFCALVILTLIRGLERMDKHGL
jgi:hypothetical protein